MFESALGTPEYLDQRNAEGRSADEIAAHRLAAAVILANLLVGIPTSLWTEERVSPLGVILAVVVARALAKLQPRAELAAMALMLFAGVVGPLGLFATQPVLDAALASVAVWAVAGPVLMLLIGEPGQPRRIWALAIFVVVRGGMYFLAFLSLLLA